MANSALSTTAAVAEGSVGESHLAAGATLKLGTEQATTSGTSIDFTGIPAGTKMIVVSLNGVSVSGASTPLIQIGDAGGIENTGYVSVSGGVTSSAVAGTLAFTTGFGLRSVAATNILHGHAILVLEDASSNTWSMSFSLGETNATVWLAGAGRKALSATLDRIRLTTANGTDTFDAGSVNIAYK